MNSIAEAESRGNRFGTRENPNPLNFDNAANGMRSHSTDVTHADGSVTRVINIGVPSDHPLADMDRRAGVSGLHNIRIGPIRLPPAPTFIIRLPRGTALNGPNAPDSRGGNNLGTNLRVVEVEQSEDQSDEAQM